MRYGIYHTLNLALVSLCCLFFFLLSPPAYLTCFSLPFFPAPFCHYCKLVKAFICVFHFILPLLCAVLCFTIGVLFAFGRSYGLLRHQICFNARPIVACSLLQEPPNRKCMSSWMNDSYNLGKGQNIMTIKPLNAISVFQEQIKAFHLMEAKVFLRSFNNNK